VAPLTFRLLEIDVTSGSWRPREIPASFVVEFLGGASLAARVLYPELTPELDPLHPAAPLLFMTGPLTGTTGPSVGRFVIGARSPATRLWGESNVGGFFGPELRSAGWDALLIRGRASEPITLHIHPGGVECLPAGHLWGNTDTYQAQAQIKKELGDDLVRVGTIGAGGENRLPFAAILFDHGRLAGRTGMGAVMGSKNLKAVSVRGSGRIPLSDPDAFNLLRSESNRELRGDTVSLSLRATGTASAADYFDYLGMMPKHYFSRGELAGAAGVSGASVAETILSGVTTCHGCVIACGRKVRLDDGVERKGPEYETMVGFGPNLGILDLATITRLGELCDRYGVDSISLSNIIGLAFHLRQAGRLSDIEADGLDLSWGNAAAVETLIHRTIRREGLGEWLAEGARALATRLGAPEEAAQVKNLEVAYHDPRGADGMALVYATSPRGACHNQSDYFMVEIGQTVEEVGISLYPRQAGAVKAANVARHQDWRTVGNSLVLCQLANVAPATVLALTNAAIGSTHDLGTLMQAGERGWQLKRLINLRLGLTPADDRLPDLLRAPLADGGAAGYAPPADAMLEAYYRVREWDPVSGAPSERKLEALSLTRLTDEAAPAVV
jgi:aldehyde:ferredoxin oxidoreductase